MKGVLPCLVHIFQDNSHPHVGTTTPMCFDYGMKKDKMERLSESWTVIIAAGTNFRLIQKQLTRNSFVSSIKKDLMWGQERMSFPRSGKRSWKGYPLFIRVSGGGCSGRGGRVVRCVLGGLVTQVLDHGWGSPNDIVSSPPRG